MVRVAAFLKKLVAMQIILEVSAEKCGGRAVEYLSKENTRKGLAEFAGIEHVEIIPWAFVCYMTVCRMNAKLRYIGCRRMQAGESL